MRDLAFYGGSSSASEVRGRQVAEALGAPWNPATRPEGAVPIFVRMFPDNLPEPAVFDPIDSHNLLYEVMAHPQVQVLALSPGAYSYLRALLPRHEIRLVPQHHCNYDRLRRPERPVKVVGFVGSPSAFQYPLAEMAEACRAVGLAFRWWIRPRRRQTVVNFYRGIDVQVVYRYYDRRDRGMRLKDALKVINAGSFGIPTVSVPEPAYEEECAGAYVPVTTPEAMVAACQRLAQEPEWYREVAEQALRKAEPHHLSHILPFYEELREVVHAL